MHATYKQPHAAQSEALTPEVLGPCYITSTWQRRKSTQGWILHLVLMFSIATNLCRGGLLRSRTELRSAVKAYLRFFPKGDCSGGPRGPIADWDVSRVTDMSNVFADARLFCGDVWKWDVSNVGDMYGMFQSATAFNSDISKWDVSKVTNMNSMFWYATSFNTDISKWDVSRVTSMDKMFNDAARFSRVLCGAAWVHSMASKGVMFEGSRGSISRTICTTTPAFSPQSKEELNSAVDTYMNDQCDTKARAPRILLVYHSRTGFVEHMVRACEAGAKSAAAEMESEVLKKDSPFHPCDHPHPNHDYHHETH